MMKAKVSFDGDEFVVAAIPHPVNAEQIDLSATVDNALRARAIERPLDDPLNLETVVISVQRFIDDAEPNDNIRAMVNLAGQPVSEDALAERHRRQDRESLLRNDRDQLLEDEGGNEQDRDERDVLLDDQDEDVRVDDLDESDAVANQESDDLDSDDRQAVVNEDEDRPVESAHLPSEAREDQREQERADARDAGADEQSDALSDGDHVRLEKDDDQS